MLNDCGPVENLHRLIADIQVGFSSFYSRVLSSERVSLSQFAVLLCLARRSPAKISEVAAALRVSLPAVSYLVVRLQEKGLIVREPQPGDRRASRLRLSASGRRIVQRTQGETTKILTGVYQRHSAAERRAVCRFLEAINNGLSDVAEK